MPITFTAVGRRPFVPIELTGAPFTLEEALRAGLTRNQLRSGCWRRLGPALYAWTGLPPGPGLLVQALARRLPEAAMFSDRTAAWLHGIEMLPEPVELTLPRQSGISGRVGVSIRRATVDPEDVVMIQGVRTTSVARTLCDLAVRLPVTEAVTAADSALRLRLTTTAELEKWTAGRAGKKGVRRMRAVLAHVDPDSESPMETRLRMLLVLAGLPRPLVQVDLEDAAGRFVARADLYYPARRLAIEYDGGTHRESLLEDNRRQNRLLGAGYRLLRFASGDVLRAPESVVSEVRSALNRAA